MSGLCLATALLLTSLYYGNASDVKFTKKTLNSTAILMNCNYRLGKSEYFSSLNITKDKRLFYSLDNSTVNFPTFTPRAGVEYIVRGASPGNFIIPRINKTTEGDYKCILYYHKKHSRKLEKESDDVDIDVDSLDFDHHEQGMKDHMDVHMTCVAHLKPNEHFVSLSVYKGSKVFYSYDDKYEPKFTPVKGIERLDMQEPGVFVIRDAKKRKVKGSYKCKVVYNGRKSYTERLHVNKSGITNMSKKLVMAVVALILINLSL